MIKHAIDSELYEYTSAPEKLSNLAKGSLEKFDEITLIARRKLEEHPSPGAGSAFASAADEATGAASLSASQSAVANDYRLLTQEPIIARIIIQYCDTKKIQLYYICRCAPPTGVQNVLSYRSEMGRLAALEVGETYDLGEETGLCRYDEQDIYTVQHVTFVPVRNGELWDSRKTEYRDCVEQELITIDSLRRLFEGLTEDSEDILASILADESKKENIIHGIRRDIVETLSLRDQPILDQYQDNIFRLPLQYSLLLLGPAGSGKTTTLIRRLGQKLDRKLGLTEDERRLVKNISDVSCAHERSWIMFTPTELLKSYLQEAFNREGIPAPDRNITTWEAYKHELGKNIFKILYTSNFESGFQYDPEVLTLKCGADISKDVYNDFYLWMISDYANDIISTLEGYSVIEKLENRKIIHEILGVSKKHLVDRKNVSSFFKDLLRYKNDISKLYDNIKKEINDLVDQELRRELKLNPKFLEELSSRLKSLSQGEDEDTENQDDTVADVFDGEEDISSAPDLKKARAEYRRILLNLSLRTSGSVKKARTTKTSVLLEWLGKRIPNDSVLFSLHKFAIEAKVLGFLSNPLNKFLRSINSRYRKFRKLRQIESTWYNPDAVLRKKIDAIELEILILVNLVVSHELLSSSDVYRNTNNSWLSILEPVKNLYVNQVLVDEAPDFSPLQLACIKLLSHPQTNSFFACGDFNQRLTTFGTKNLEDLKSFLPGRPVEIRKINTPYRQRKELYEFSSNVLKMMGAEVIETTKTSSAKMLKGFSPVLGEKLANTHLAIWLADRIVEIEKLSGIIPSIAILVPEEEYVRPVAKELEMALNGKTTAMVQACYEGQAKGNERAVRVFDIKHIKGLEFEAAFFVALDRLESLCPELLGNYLYVGATRAATFLGVSCEKTIPKQVNEALRCYFVDQWSIPS